MTMGIQEMVAARVKVFTESGDTLTFGVYPGGANNPMKDGKSAPLLSLQVSRQINQPGMTAFALPGRNHLEVGEPWRNLISLGDYVQVDAVVQRAPTPAAYKGDGGGYSHSWRTIFLGRVLEVEESDFRDGDGFVYSTLVTCDDFLGSIDSPHFSYWRKLGATFGVNGDMLDKLSRLDKIDLTAGDLSISSVSVAASIILTSFIEGRMDIKRKLNGKDISIQDTYGYRFEGDDLQTPQDLKQLAPEAQSWKAALQATVDGPHFYEMFQDSLPRRAAQAQSASTKSGEVGRSNPGQFRSRAPAYAGTGDYGELLVIRPAPFPVYREEITGGAAFYSQAAWDALPLIKAAPFAHSNLKVSKSRRELFSVFSTNITYASFGDKSDNSQANQSLQMVGDLHKLLHVSGYVPLDVSTIRSPMRTKGSKNADLDAPKLNRILAFQLFSFNQLNDIYLNGTSEIPLDLRLQLGARWVEADMMFYIEGYKHTFSPEGSSSALTLSRGLPVEYYGHEPTGRPKMADKMNYVKKYLGRKRPEDRLAPKAALGIMSELNKKTTVGG